MLKHSCTVVAFALAALAVSRCQKAAPLVPIARPLPTSTAKPVSFSFDPSNPEHTLRWLARLHNDLYDYKGGNELQEADLRHSIQAALDSMRGKAVRWPLRTDSIGKVGVVFAVLEWPQDPDRALKMYEHRSWDPVFSLCLAVDDRKASLESLSGAPNRSQRSFPLPEGQWIRGVSVGTPLVLSGSIAAVATAPWPWQASSPPPQPLGEQVFVYITNPVVLQTP